MPKPQLAVDRYAHAIQCLKPGAVQTVATNTSTSTASANATDTNTVVVRLVASTDCFVIFGLSGVTATTTTGFFLPQGAQEYFRMDDGPVYIAAIAASTGGSLYITEML